MKFTRIFKLGMIVFAAVMFLSAAVSGQTSSVSSESNDGWKLVWSDEFNGTTLDTNVWNYDAGGGGWGNNELQFFSIATDCVNVENGNLIIRANKQKLGGYNYSSGRINTKGKKEFTYGKIAARIKLPYGQGIWPAFWMMGSNIDQNSWPECGEIDIMEMIGGAGNSNKTVYAHVHWNDNGHQVAGNNQNGLTGYKLKQPAYLDYHIFEIEWSETNITWKVDGQLEFTKDIDNTMSAFRKPFYFIVNVSVGGKWPGKPDKAKTKFPQTMTIDWIRVYQR